MSTTPETTAFERGISPIIELVLPGKAEQVVSFQGDKRLRRRIEELASKSNEGELIEEERSEYTGYVRANKFIALLQRQARRLVRDQP